MPLLRQWLPYYERRFERLSRGHRQLVGQSSLTILDRLLAPARSQPVGRGRCGTKPGSRLHSKIPIRTGTWDLSRLAYLEADRVAHCGGSLAGDLIWSLPYTDILSGWTEGGAVGNKGAAGVLATAREGWPAGARHFLGKWNCSRYRPVFSKTRGLHESVAADPTQ